MEKTVIPKPDSGKNPVAAGVRRDDATTLRKFGFPMADGMASLGKRVDEIRGRIMRTKNRDLAALRENVDEFAGMLRELASQNPNCKFEINVESKPHDPLYGDAVMLEIILKVPGVRAIDQYVFVFEYGGARVFNLTQFGGASMGSLLNSSNASSGYVQLWMLSSARRAKDYNPNKPSSFFN